MEHVTIKATIYWAQLNRQNDLSNKYQVDLCQLSDGAVEALENFGLTIHNNGDERANFITCKSTRPIRAYDNNGSIMDEAVMVGNGSKALAIVGFFEWTFKNKKGRSPNLGRLKITDLVAFEADGGDVTEDDAL